ncbi:MAG: hypothetical protein O7E57_15660, partial [Gammaproteobacteria bacterium]|nr:hypothetical protein [Gammaproteobacteria bacterium]
MLTLRATTILMLLTTATAHAQPSALHDGELIIRGGWLFDGVSDSRRINSGIIIRNGEIVEVDATVQQQIPNTAKLLNLLDSETILP